MYETGIKNIVELRGILVSAPVFSHESRGERFFTFPIETRRLSGATDRLNIMVRESLLNATELSEASRIHVTGELRSFNNKHGDGAKLVVTIFARELAFDDDEDLNLVELAGTLCKPPNLRITPMGRDICDLMLAVGRRCGRSDYLPCICWGIRAHEASQWSIGDKISLVGRIQSRQYIKLIEGAAIEKTAYEVSVIDIEKV